MYHASSNVGLCIVNANLSKELHGVTVRNIPKIQTLARSLFNRQLFSFTYFIATIHVHFTITKQQLDYNSDDKSLFQKSVKVYQSICFILY